MVVGRDGAGPANATSGTSVSGGSEQSSPRSSTALPVVPAPSSRVRPGVFSLGDSVMLGAERSLVAEHYRVDAKVGRQFFEGIVALRNVRRSGGLPRNVVVHLGTNGTITTRHCESMVANAGPLRRVFFVTVFGPRSWMSGNDRVLRACAARHRGGVVLIDWATAAAHHPGWLGRDRIHPNTLGHKEYTALIESTVTRYQL